KGDVFFLYRAFDGSSRDMTLLASSDNGKTFKPTIVSRWAISTCPMSSSTMAETGNGLLVATEKAGQVSVARVSGSGFSLEGDTAAPGMGKRKHPVVLANTKGETLLAWTENMGWNKGGSLAWQLYSADNKAEGEKGTARGVPVWSL